MRISPTDLQSQYRRAVADWPWVLDVEEDCNLPPFLLLALGSRESNLRNVRQAAPGLGLGVWQRDAGVFKDLQGHEDEFMADLQHQAVMAASLLRSHFEVYRREYRGTAVPVWRAAVCAYNAGRGGVRNAIAAGRTPDSATTGGDYGDDVLCRHAYLAYWGWRLL